MGELEGRRALVVGASKGIGRAIAGELDAEGARVAFAARSKDRLAEAVASCRSGAVAVECDVRDPLAVEAVVEQTVAAFGGIDALVYATGMARFRSLAEAEPDDWATVLETNLVGAALVTRQAIPHLVASAGHAVYFSSNSAWHQPPWRGLGLYTASKAALEKLTRCWEVEHPEVAFTNVVVGPTASEFGSDDAEGLSRYVGEWYEKGYIGASTLDPGVHARAIVDLLRSPAHIQTLMVVPR